MHPRNEAGYCIVVERREEMGQEPGALLWHLLAFLCLRNVSVQGIFAISLQYLLISVREKSLFASPRVPK